MSELVATPTAERPTVEVRVYRFGELAHQERCASDEEACAVVDRWIELVGVDCEMEHLPPRRLEEILQGVPAR